ncbi:MAG: cation diffusion facilitator family transporter [Muribaculaceae bacterium]|nr:cation diffusion facilitator family transporter [Muribaculaceae bacterium]
MEKGGDRALYLYMGTREKEIYRVTIVGTIVNAVLVAIKFVAGIMERSSALVADAVHSLTDFITDIIVLVFVHISGKPNDEQHRYGHGKFETLATTIIGVLLSAAGIGLLINGGEQVWKSLNGEALPEPTWIALAVAFVSVIAKEILYRYTVREGKRLNSDAVIANGWHHRSDAISSISTMVGIGGAMFLGEKWRIFDPLAAAVVSIFIIKAGYDIIKPAINELLEASLPKEQTDEIDKLIRSIDGVRGLHNMRTRKIGNAIAVDMHVKMDGNLSLTKAHEIATSIEQAIRKEYGEESYINVHMEPV